MHTHARTLNCKGARSSTEIFCELNTPHFLWQYRRVCVCPRQAPTASRTEGRRECKIHSIDAAPLWALWHSLGKENR